MASENEEDDEMNEFVKDGFVVDDEEEEESGSSDDGERRRRRKKKKREKNLKRLKQRDDDALDDEDIRLMRENLGMTTEKGQESDSEEDLSPSKKV